ncbi:phosphopantetheine-binding protein [Streptomyces sp. NPDC001793]|uniref:acyl carrier protein n=1 Tax=Streptomyces sp. NPDC001793 TaxID=3154657 RepID=UPI00331A1757
MTQHNTAEIDRIVLDYLASHGTTPEPAREEDLFETGRVNSLFAIQLMSFLESRFGVEVDVDDLNLRNFASIAKITDFVQRKQLEADPA